MDDPTQAVISRIRSLSPPLSHLAMAHVLRGESIERWMTDVARSATMPGVDWSKVQDAIRGDADAEVLARGDETD